MHLYRALSILACGLVVLVVSFAVLSGASQVSAAIEDHSGAALLWRIAVACLILLIIDLLLLVGILSVRALEESSESDHNQNPTDDDSPRIDQ